MIYDATRKKINSFSIDVMKERFKVTGGSFYSILSRRREKIDEEIII